MDRQAVAKRLVRLAQDLSGAREREAASALGSALYRALEERDIPDSANLVGLLKKPVLEKVKGGGVSCLMWARNTRQGGLALKVSLSDDPVWTRPVSAGEFKVNLRPGYDERKVRKACDLLGRKAEALAADWEASSRVWDIVREKKRLTSGQVQELKAAAQDAGIGVTFQNMTADDAEWLLDYIRDEFGVR